jgi:hypothetical protein
MPSRSCSGAINPGVPKTAVIASPAAERRSRTAGSSARWRSIIMKSMSAGVLSGRMRIFPRFNISVHDANCLEPSVIQIATRVRRLECARNEVRGPNEGPQAVSSAWQRGCPRIEEHTVDVIHDDIEGSGVSELEAVELVDPHDVWVIQRDEPADST